MSLPSKMKLTPTATVTSAFGIATDASSEVWQQVAGGKFIVYEQVPFALAAEIAEQQDGKLDTHIALRLAGYPKRVSS